MTRNLAPHQPMTRNVALLVIAAASLLLTMAPAAAAIQYRDEFTTLKVSGIVEAGDIHYSIIYPEIVPTATSLFRVTAQIDGPPPPLAGATSLTITFSGASGCTVGTGVNQVSSGLFGSMRVDSEPITMASNECTAFAEGVYSAGPAGLTQIAHFYAALDVRVDTQQNIQSGTLNNVLSGTINIGSWPTLNLAGSISTATTLSGSINIGSWPTLNLAGTVNTVTSGSLTVHQDPLSGTVSVSPLSGTLTVHQDPLSGTLAVTNSGSQSISLSGAVTVHQDPLSGTVSVSPLSGTLTVHQDPTTGSLGITSFPALTVHQDPICTAAAHCHIDSDANMTVNLGSTNQSVIVEVPETLHLCGPPTTTNTCPPVGTSSTANLLIGTDGTLDIFILAAVGAWLWAASRLMPVRLLGVVVELFAGFRALHLDPLPFGGSALGIIFLSLGAIFFLHMAVSTLLAAIAKRSANQAQATDAIDGDTA